MSNQIFIMVVLLVLSGCNTVKTENAGGDNNPVSEVVIVKPGFTGDRISDEWKSAITRRMSNAKLDSMSGLRRQMTSEEKEWVKLIESKTSRWNQFKDSLAVPFSGIKMNDTIYVLLGYLGVDDGFTYKFHTVCFDVTALNRQYGSATQPVNDNRMDRLFAHEYTHLLHKVWADRKNLKLTSYRDSILWECLYEGIGMYRSLSAKWFPVNDSLPEITGAALNRLYPVFADRLTTIETSSQLTKEEKIRLHTNLSRGSVANKWGALPMAIWLAMEADGDDKKLISWIEKGPEGVIDLAAKYLDEESKKRFEAAFAHP